MEIGESIDKLVSSSSTTLVGVEGSLEATRLEPLYSKLYRILYELYSFSVGDPRAIRELIYAKAVLALLLSSVFYESIGFISNLKPLTELAITAAKYLFMCVRTRFRT